MCAYTLKLELPEKPNPEVLQRILEMTGLLSSDDTEEKHPSESQVAEGQPSQQLPASPDPGLLMDRAQAAQFLNISTGTLDRWRKKGIVPFVQFEGTAPMFSRNALEEFVRTNSRIRPQRRKAPR